ncbi:hypothetical protein H9W84_11030 [Moraxella sp. PS-22]|jgi:hypothetical protein|uniref:Uncharacterized protein n=1 Tax=Moraxella tetraodonis TaxID=2767221 RepID=A0A9X1UT54_9GAMM|nr:MULTISPECIES: hypothetical protein [Moraxella]MCG8148648.1 hypothetical protein [Moraxella tetraodonis]
MMSGSLDVNDEQYRREQQYQQNMVRYHAELNAWHQLSDEQKARHSNEAEDNSRRFWSFVFTAFISYLLYKSMRPSIAGDAFWLSWGGISVVILLISLWLANYLGKLIRAVVYAGIGAGVSYGLMYLFMNDASDGLKNGIAIGLGIILFLLGVFTDIFKASGAPREPIKPQGWLD